MITGKRLKIWTIITHGLIIIGAGHGIMCMFILEVFSFINIVEGNFSLSSRTTENHFALIGVLTFCGQLSLIYSIVAQNRKIKITFHVVGLLLLWLSLAYFIYDTANDNYTHIALFTTVPFTICTIIAFAGKFLMKLYKYVIED